MDTEALLSSCPDERYEILSLLDGGGKSCVYKARDRTTEKVVAIKFLFPDVKHSDEALTLFTRRAKAAAGLSHPNLSRILDYGVSGDGKPFLVTEYVEGRSLMDFLNRSGRLKVSRAIEVFVQLARLLDYIHSSGFVHGDIKPGYVMLAEGGGRQNVKLTDIGLSRVLSSSLASTPVASGYDHFLYISPEQCKEQEVEPRSDVYSLGCLMYETLTGLPPFISRNPQEIIQMHVIDEPKSMREARSDIPLPFELDLLVGKALRKTPAQRHQSMTELADDLEHVKTLVSSDKEEQSVSYQHLAALQGPAPWSYQPNEFPLATKVKIAIPIILGVLILGFSGVFAVMFSKQLAHMKSQDERIWEDCEAKGERAIETESWPAAEKAYLEAVKTAEKFGDNDRRLLVSLRKLQDVYLSEGKSDEADKIESRLRQLLGDEEKTESQLEEQVTPGTAPGQSVENEGQLRDSSRETAN